jgi:hypothetical protein
LWWFCYDPEWFVTRDGLWLIVDFIFRTNIHSYLPLIITSHDIHYGSY